MHKKEKGEKKKSPTLDRLDICTRQDAVSRCNLTVTVETELCDI